MNDTNNPTLYEGATSDSDQRAYETSDSEQSSSARFRPITRKYGLACIAKRFHPEVRKLFAIGCAYNLSESHKQRQQALQEQRTARRDQWAWLLEGMQIQRAPQEQRMAPREQRGMPQVRRNPLLEEQQIRQAPQEQRVAQREQQGMPQARRNPVLEELLIRQASQEQRLAPREQQVMPQERRNQLQVPLLPRVAQREQRGTPQVRRNPLLEQLMVPRASQHMTPEEMRTPIRGIPQDQWNRLLQGVHIQAPQWVAPPGQRGMPPERRTRQLEELPVQGAPRQVAPQEQQRSPQDQCPQLLEALQSQRPQERSTRWRQAPQDELSAQREALQEQWTRQHEVLQDQRAVQREALQEQSTRQQEAQQEQRTPELEAPQEQREPPRIPRCARVLHRRNAVSSENLNMSEGTSPPALE